MNGPSEDWPAPAAPHLTTARTERQQRVGRPVLALVFLGVVGVVVLGILQDELGSTALVIGAAVALLPVAVVVRAYLWLDRWEPEPAHHLRVAFGWGASAAALLAITLNTALVAAFATTVPTDVAEQLGAILVAPIVEEASKGLILLWFLWRHRHEIDGLLDGLVLAGMVGVGFAFTENILYFGRAFTLGIDESGLVGGFLVTTTTFVMRGVASPFAHPLFTSMLGVGVAIAAGTRRSWLAVTAPTIGFLAAVCLHAVWNASAVSGERGFFVTYFSVMAPLFLLAVVVAVWSRRREGRIVARRLPAYAAAGWLAPHEARLLADPHARAQLVAQARGFGDQRARATRAYHAVVTELCFLRERLARGTAGPDALIRQEALLHELVRMRPGALTQPPFGPPGAWYPLR